jgi:hypothetical protein
MIETLIGFYGAFLCTIENNSTLKSHLWWKFIKKPQIQLNLRHVKPFNQNFNLRLFDFRRNKALENPPENLWWNSSRKCGIETTFLDEKKSSLNKDLLFYWWNFPTFPTVFLEELFCRFFLLFKFSLQISIPQKNSSKNLWFNKTCFTFFSFPPKS